MNTQAALDSRKFKMGLLVMFIILSLAASTMWFPQMAAVMVEVIGGLVAVYGIYCGANVANKYAVGKVTGDSYGFVPENLPYHQPPRQQNPNSDALPGI